VERESPASVRLQGPAQMNDNGLHEMGPPETGDPISNSQLMPILGRSA
jgi:hypothetical protein